MSDGNIDSNSPPKQVPKFQAFTTVPTAIIRDLALSLGARVLYLFLASHSMAGPPSLSNVEIQNALGISATSLSKYRKNLIDEGFLRTEHSYWEDGGISGNIYYLTGIGESDA